MNAAKKNRQGTSDTRQIQKKKDQLWRWGYRCAPFVLFIGIMASAAFQKKQRLYYSFWLERDRYSLETITLESVKEVRAKNGSYIIVTGTISGKLAQAESYALAIPRMTIDEIRKEIVQNPVRTVFVNHNALGQKVNRYYAAVVAVEHGKSITTVSVITLFFACNSLAIFGAVLVVYFYWVHVSRRLWAISGGRIGSPD